ncbi:MAG: c-type cytochrome [Ardenticatenaceae bacterium]|nr:c-type cytochrome [Anaerolineales bacterium]MCB8941421.1 c-type cytochrome [Ardenticatenaceae bacterium]MCB8972777.1 c-type cytochrome [Ardenticatenaceae bacterium]
MKKIFLFSTLLFIIVLTACGPTAVSEPAVEEANTTSTESSGMGGMGMGMGMGGSMMAAHHATIPDEYAGLTNPIPADEDSLARGGEIFATHCATCHGDGGVGDGPGGASLNPAPANIAHTSQMLGDDYLFWRVSEGGAMEPFNSGMIAWKGILDEQARWDVLNYVQALGAGTVTPGQHMGGATFDPAVEAQNQADMLATAVSQAVITQEEADTFAAAHTIVDARMMELRRQGSGDGMDDMMADILAELVAAGSLTQAHADTFLSVHDRLGAAGLMQ